MGGEIGREGKLGGRIKKRGTEGDKKEGHRSVPLMNQPILADV